MEVWYTLISDLLFFILAFYVPAVYLLQPKRGKWHTAYLGWVVLYYLWAIVIRYMVEVPFAPLQILLNIIAMWLLLRLLYRDEKKKLLLVIFSLYCMGFSVDIVSLLLFNVLIDKVSYMWIFNAQSDTYTYVTRIMAFLVGDSFTMIYALVWMCLIRRRNWRVFFGFMLIPVYQLFLAGGFLLLCGDFSVRVAQIGLGMGIFSFLLDFVILFILEEIFKKMDKETEMLELEKKRQREYEYYAADSRYVENMRLIRHDFANQLQAVYGLMDDPGNAGKIKELLKEMEQNISDVEDSVEEME